MKKKYLKSADNYDPKISIFDTDNPKYVCLFSFFGNFACFF